MIGETWSADEIMDAAALDELEAAGQAKRLVARVCAEIHNAVRMAAWSTHARKGDKPPERLLESQFLPVKVTKQKSSELEESRKNELNENLRQTTNAMCGF